MGADIRTEGHHAVIRGVPQLSAAPVRALDIRAGMALVIAVAVRGRGHRDLRRAPHRPRVRGPRRQARSAGRRCPPRRRCGRRARPGGRPVIPQPPGVEPAFTGMPAPPVDVPPRPDEPTAPGSGPQGLPAVDWSFPRALLVGLVTNLLLAQVVVGGIAFIALGITDVDDPKTIYAGLIGDVAWLGFMLIWLVRWHPDWRARIGVFVRPPRRARRPRRVSSAGCSSTRGSSSWGSSSRRCSRRCPDARRPRPISSHSTSTRPRRSRRSILAVFVAPVAEELFFRGHPVPEYPGPPGVLAGSARLRADLRAGALRGRRLAGHRAAAVDHGLHRRGARLDLRTPWQPRSPTSRRTWCSTWSASFLILSAR